MKEFYPYKIKVKSIEFGKTISLVIFAKNMQDAKIIMKMEWNDPEKYIPIGTPERIEIT